VSRHGLVWFFGAFGLLLVAGALIGSAAITFLSSLMPLYVSIGLSIGAIVCVLVALARHVGERE
jgi:hypothetical protein